MATLEELSAALKNADAAGDVEAARVLADEIQRVQSTTVKKGGFLPLSVNAAGRLQLDPQAGVLGSIISGITLPRDVAQRKFAVNPSQPDAWSDEDEARLEANNRVAFNRVMDLAGVAAPVNPAVRAGDRALPGVAQALRAEKPAVPTAQELAEVGGRDINLAKTFGPDIASRAVADYSRKLQQELFDAGIHPTRAPDTYKILQEVANAPADSVFSTANLQTLRETIQQVARNFNPSASADQLAASRVIKRLDEFLPSVSEKDIVAGAVAPAQRMFERGRGNYAAAQRSNDLTGVLDRANTGIVERAEVRAQANHSGRNIDNTIRQRIASLLEKPKDVSGFTDKEIGALNQIVAGGKAKNFARRVGNWLGGGGGLGQTSIAALLGGAGAMSGFGVGGSVALGAIPFALGTGARAMANALTKKEVRGIDEMIRKRSPLYKEREANPRMTVISPEKRAALLRALLLSDQPAP